VALPQRSFPFKGIMPQKKKDPSQACTPEIWTIDSNLQFHENAGHSKKRKFKIP
jgi:hypothetical protein